MLKIKISEDTFKQLDDMVRSAPESKQLTHEKLVERAVDNYFTAYLIGQGVKKNAESIVRSLWTEEELEKMEKEFNERKENYVEKGEK